MLGEFFKSVIDQDETAIVICDLNHKIIYMNPVAIDRYKKRGGKELIGKNLLDCHNEHSVMMIKKVISWFEESEDNNRMYTYFNEKENKDVYMIALRNDDKKLIGYYEKHVYRTKENGIIYDFK